MSYFVVLIEAPDTWQPVSSLATCQHAISICAITVSSNPPAGLSTLQSYSPIPLTLLHSIEANNRADDLERTLHIKYAQQRLRPKDFWFKLTAEDIAFIKTITANNIMQVTGLIKRALAPPPAPVIETAKLPDFIKQQLDTCQTLLEK